MALFEKVKSIIEEHIDCDGVCLTPDTVLLKDLSIN